MEFLTGPCPACGKPLQIPADLTEFSCLYCGARLKQADLLPCPTGSADTLLAGLGDCVTNYRDTISHLLPKKYEPRFQEYCNVHGDLLKNLDQVSPAQFEAVAAALVQHIGQWADRNQRPLVRRDSLLEDAKYTLCLLFVPAVQHLAPGQGKAFCEKLLDIWLEQNPKHIFQLTTYENITGGFDRKKLCFITTAVCTYQGKSDDCAELTAFRAFRDGWLTAQPDGQALIREYYAIAPAIVTAINVTDPDSLYPALWRQYLRPCYDAILRGNFSACKRIYTRMVRSLSHRYLINKE